MLDPLRMVEIINTMDQFRQGLNGLTAQEIVRDINDLHRMMVSIRAKCGSVDQFVQEVTK